MPHLEAVTQRPASPRCLVVSNAHCRSRLSDCCRGRAGPDLVRVLNLFALQYLIAAASQRVATGRHADDRGIESTG
jgi:hypothetical protein